MRTVRTTSDYVLEDDVDTIIATCVPDNNYQITITLTEPAFASSPDESVQATSRRLFIIMDSLVGFVRLQDNGNLGPVISSGSPVYITCKPGPYDNSNPCPRLSPDGTIETNLGVVLGWNAGVWGYSVLSLTPGTWLQSTEPRLR